MPICVPHRYRCSWLTGRPNERAVAMRIVSSLIRIPVHDKGIALSQEPRVEEEADCMHEPRCLSKRAITELHLDLISTVFHSD